MHLNRTLPVMKCQAYCALPFLLLLAQCFSQEGATANEYQVKAAYLFNFAKFVEWPPAAFRTADAPLEICVLGVDPFNHEIEASIAGKIVNGHRLQVSHTAAPSDLKSCQIVFIANSERGQTKDILQRVTGASVLTVGDMADFAGQGGMINFVLDGDRVRFEVNDEAARRVHLKLSARLLTVAKAVVGRSSNGKP